MPPSDNFSPYYNYFRGFLPQVIIDKMTFSDLFLRELMEGSGYIRTFLGFDALEDSRGAKWAYWLGGGLRVIFYENGTVTVQDKSYDYEEDHISAEEASSDILRRLLILIENDKKVG